jgi:hypothetical protein
MFVQAGANDKEDDDVHRTDHAADKQCLGQSHPEEALHVAIQHK